MRTSSLVVAATLLASTSCAQVESPVGPPVELGAIRWERDFDAAKQRAAASGKPILLLFQEVPG